MQAQRARILDFNQCRSPETNQPRSGRVITITGGKGGVGKTLTTINFAHVLTKQGLKCLVLDGDFGLANIDVMLGISYETEISLEDIFSKKASLSETIIKTGQGFDIIPSGSGVFSLTSIKPWQKIILIDQLYKVISNYDILLIDTPAGIGDTVLTLSRLADALVVVTTPDPHAMTDAYALIKVLREQTGEKNFNILANLTSSPEEGLKIFRSLTEVTERFLGVSLKYAGFVPKDPQMARFVLNQRAASHGSSHTLASQAWSQALSNVQKYLSLREPKSANPVAFASIPDGPDSELSELF